MTDYADMTVRELKRHRSRIEKELERRTNPLAPWSWIPHTEGADRQKEINAFLRRLMDDLPVATGPSAYVSNLELLPTSASV